MRLFQLQGANMNNVGMNEASKGVVLRRDIPHGEDLPAAWKRWAGQKAGR
jgi:hypothetical protein